VRRREVVWTSLLGLSLPAPAWPQPARKVFRIGILAPGAAADAVGPEPRSPQLRVFVRAMRELGYVYGKDFVIEARGADGHADRFPALAAELVGLQPDVIVAAGSSLNALKQATTHIPIVMASHSDPVHAGYVQSLSHPGGNMTGLSFGGVELTAKQLELLKELVPGAMPTAVLFQPPSPLVRQAAEAASRARGWKLLMLEIRDLGDVEGAFKAASDAPVAAMLVTASPPTFTNPRRVTELAAKYRLPAIYEARRFVDAGGLMSYGANIADIWRHAAVFVDKILKGAMPADLPVEQPTKFELFINLKTAQNLGITIPLSLLLRADEVVE
jgi:ABC-type uncharacterized transport system substrate-binding protein